jgi:hypothetical protein
MNGNCDPRPSIRREANPIITNPIISHDANPIISPQ